MGHHRHRFIWLRDQAIDHAAMFMTIHAKPLRRDEEGTNHWVMARGEVALDHAAKARLNITVDGRYRLYVNGVVVGHGPARSNPGFQNTDSYEIELRAGRNQFAVLTHVPGKDLAWYETRKDAAQTVFGDGGLCLWGEVQTRTGKLNFEADEDWRMVKSKAWRQDAPLSGWGQDFIEDVDTTLLDAHWFDGGFDDSSWPLARFMIAEPACDERARGWGKAEPFRYLESSLIPPLTQDTLYPSCHIWSKALEPKPDLGVKERLYAETLRDLDGDCVVECENLLTEQGTTTITTPKESDVAILMAFDPYHVGRPFIDFEAKGGEVIEIALSEALPGEFGRGNIGDGLRNEGKLWVTHIVRYCARAGRQRFDKFNPTGFRALQLVVRNAPNGIIVHEIGSIATHYPVVFGGHFQCEDPLITKLWQVGKYTVLMCAQDGWLDCPGRESRQWLGDGMVMFDMANLAFGPSIFALHRQFLNQITQGQRQDGLARMVSPGDIPARSVTIPDYSALWIIGVERYYLASGDLECLRHQMPHIELCLRWFERHSDDTGLVYDVPEWHFIEWADLDRRGYPMSFNALYVGALKAAKAIAGYIGYDQLADQYEKRITKLIASLNRLHWDKDRGLYVDSVACESLALSRRVSQHGNGLALLFGIAPEQHRASILSAMTDPSRLRLTDAPPIMSGSEAFDENIHIVRVNSFFAHFVYEALAKSGRFEWVIDDMRVLYGPMLAKGATTLWESFEPIASLCHGFSATPVYQLSRYGLGVEALTPGYERFSVGYWGANLDKIEGMIPTLFGVIKIVWTIEKDRAKAELSFPISCRLEFEGEPVFALINHEVSQGQATLWFDHKCRI